MKKRWINILFAAVAALLFVAVTANATDYHYMASVYKYDATKSFYSKSQTGTALLETGVTYKVLTAGSTTASTIYTTAGWTKGSSKTNPVTTTIYLSDGDGDAGKIDFWATTSTVDLIVVDTVGGFTAFVEDFSPNQRTILIDESPNVMHHGIIWFGVSSAVETDTGIDFIADTFIHDVRVQVVTADAGMTLDVGLLSTGTGGDADGFIALRSMTGTGYVADTGVITAGASIDYTAATTYGVLLYTAITGTGAVTTPSYYHNGGRSYIGHIVTGSNTGALTYTGSSGSDTAAGYIHYWFTRMK